MSKRVPYKPAGYVPILPLTLAEVKDHCAIVDDDSFDVVLDGLMRTALASCEHYTRRKLCTQTWDVYYDAFADPLVLPFPPVQAIGSVKYLDCDGVLQTLSTAVYELGEEDGVQHVRRAYNQAWPAVRSHYDVVVMRMTCGYGEAVDVPDDLKHGLKLLIQHLFENPAPVNIGNIVNDIPWTIAALWDNFRVTKVGSC